ncbi:MAG: DeoR family transcriptional regulator [Bradyrhizobiaceae bacterium]|nr:DeoR family transcriptional regulator [Bradyrhizobiaceae bacterium]
MGRIVELLKLGKKVTVATVAEDLQFSSRTVARDLDYLVHVLGAPIEYDRIQRSFVLTEKGLPLILDLYIRSHLRQEAKRAIDHTSTLAPESEEFVGGLAYVHEVIGRVLSYQ